jgi:adenylate cyclase
VEARVRRLDPALEWTLPHVKQLLSLPTADPGAQGLDEAQRKRRLIDAVKALTLRLARLRPLFLIVEDLHGTDRSSEESLASLVDSLSEHPVLLVCTYRGDYVPPWQDRSIHQRLAIDPLSGEEAAQLVEGLLGPGEGSSRVRDLVTPMAEGNPLFIEELIGYLGERGLLASPAPSRDGPALGGGDLPATIHDLLTARIDRLPEPLKRTVQIASVLGREFNAAILEAIAPPGADLARDLSDLVRRELLHEKSLFPDARYSFTHVLVQQVAYQGLLQKSRSEIHGAAGAALERLYAGRPDEVLQELAEHYARSTDLSKAFHYLVRAGDRASALFAHHEARAYYARALRALPPGPDGEEKRVIALQKLGDAAYAEGALDESLDCWTDALGLVLGRGDRRAAADLHRRVGVACWDAGRRDEALSHLETGLSELGEDVENLEAARICQELGRIHFRLGNHEEAMKWAEQALTLGHRLGAADVISPAHNTLGIALARAGDLESGAESVLRSLEAARANQLGSVACRAYTNLAVMYATLDPARSAEYCREGLALAEKIGDQLQQSWLYCALAGGYCTLAGDYDEGVNAVKAAAELDERLGQRNHLPIPLILLAQIYGCRGHYELSARYYREALAVAEAVGEPQMLVPCYDGLATVAIETGDEAGAEEWLALSRRAQEATGWSSDTFLLLPFLC